MAWGKSKSEGDGLPPEHDVADAAPSPHFESGQRDSVLVALVTQTEQLNERLTKLENRFDAAMSGSVEDDTDLRDLRVYSARLAAELQRVTEELRSDIDGLSPDTDQATIDLRSPETDPQDEESTAVSEDADVTLRLPRAGGRSGWLPMTDD